MNPVLETVSDAGDMYSFTLSNINVSLANALRRIILSEIPTVCFYTENNSGNQCNIEKNTTRLHNEILKHRLSCIPVHEKDLTLLPDKYILELDMKNESDNMIIVTTEHFRIKNKLNDNYLTKDETRRIFPPCKRTNQYIDFVRLRPKISDTIPGEHIKLTAEFSVHNCRNGSGVYSVVSKCSYGNTPDREKAATIWEDFESKLKLEESTREDIEFQKKNFDILDSQRYFKPDSFDFVVETIGVYENKEIVRKGCSILYDKFTQLIIDIDSDSVSISRSETTMDNCFDIVLENEDYTIGKVAEIILNQKYYTDDKILSFCGFKKFHPHNDESIIRLAYFENVDKRMVAQHLRASCAEAVRIFKKLYEMFG
jgi:DNA-directed RNA polymerase alpha subunit